MRSTHIKALAIVLLGAIVVGSIWIGTEYQKDIHRAQASVANSSQIVATPCGRIEYAQTGNGPVILMIHGAGGGFDQGILLARSFVPQGFRVIAMSRFGYLRTLAPEHASIVLQADAHACLLDALGVQSAAVIGASAGAPSALEFALRYPERCRALVLVVPGWWPLPQPMTRRFGPLTAAVFERALRSDFAFWVISKFFPSAAIRSVLGTPPSVVAQASAGEQARVDSMLWSILPVSQRSTGLLLEARLTSEALSKPLSSLQVPTLAISAKDDLYGTWENAQFIVDHVPHARFIGYSVGGHLLVGHSDEVLASIGHFLADNAPDARH